MSVHYINTLQHYVDFLCATIASHQSNPTFSSLLQDKWATRHKERERESSTDSSHNSTLPRPTTITKFPYLQVCNCETLPRLGISARASTQNTSHHLQYKFIGIQQNRQAKNPPQPTITYPSLPLLLLMENCSKLHQTLPHNLQMKHGQCLLFGSIRLSTFLVAILMEACFVLNKWKPISHLLPLSFLFAFFAFERFLARPHGTYLVDFSCFRPPSFCRAPFSTFIEHTSMLECFDKESIAFMSKIISSSGQGEETYLPPPLHYIPPRTHHHESIKEAEMVLFPVMDDLLSKTHISPHDIDILIVNCCGFCPSPSLSSIVVNRYAMRSDIKSFNLSGMGCSASTIGVDLANNLLKIHKDSFAIILSTEIVSTGWYPGNDRSKLLLNCLFRMGSAAILLTNKKEAKRRSKYKLLRSVRTQRAFDDKAYLSAIREEDSKGITGVSLKRDLLEVAGETLRSNASVLFASMLPLSEKLRYGVSILRKRFIDSSEGVYVPDLKSVIEHYCVPTSGMAVIREIGKGLKVGEREMEAAMMTFQRFGNQSSASMWYELAYMEAKGKVKKGHKVWQLGMGSGPKASSVVWECRRHLGDECNNKGPWFDCIHRYPIFTFASDN